ncbi:pro-epidermal growth factor [Thalassophryne amazonica]|uniref:pro-epidermal growth factor n=1 Tax=Thalassophryne amazonica TaxID=390379 RepID=UPI001471C1F5|nr:pro-epidermal growth factor [Thalassophryne amazonica]
MDLDGKNQQRLVAGVGSSILLDFHFQEERIYWADTHTGIIYKTSVRAALRQKLHSSDKHISGLAVDWIWNTVYWTSDAKGKIRRMDLNGKNERILLRHLTQPRLIAIDPNSRFLFWLSGGTRPSIQRSDLNGHRRITLIKVAEELKALTVDRKDKRLFWIQFGLQGESAIVSCDYNGNILHIIDQQLRSESLAVSVFLDQLYYTDTTSRAVKQVNKYMGGEPKNVNLKQLAKPPVGIMVVHLLNQPTAESLSPFSGCDEESGKCVNVCSNVAERGVCQCTEGFVLNKQGSYCEDVNECALWNHGCSLGCENVPGSYFCTCPKGYALLPDKKTCREILPCDGNMTKCGNGCLVTDEGAVCLCPQGSILREDGQACTGCSSADRGGCSQLCTPVTSSSWQCGCLPGYQLQQDGKCCMATGQEPYLLVADLVDVRRVNPDGTKDQILVEEPRGAFIALDYDLVQNHVYFASTFQKTIERTDLNGGPREVLVSQGLGSPEGLAVDWVHRRMYWTDSSQSRIDCSTTGGLKRETIVSKGLQKPRGITVHPLAKKIYWTDIGVQPVVETASLEGKDRVVIARANLKSPSGLTIDFTEDRLFWCDQSTGRVETTALDGSDRRILLENQVGRPFDLAVFEDRLWVSDWDQNQLRSFHKRTGKKLQRIHGNMIRPASVVVVHPLAKPAAVKNRAPWATTSSHADVDMKLLNSNSLASCPSTHDSYCLYQGVCVYFPEMESYACNCASGYMGERCQFNDLEWWELQQAEEVTRRNVLIAACMVVLITLLFIVVCATYCYRTRRFFQKQPSVDNVSETSVTDENMTETINTSRPQVITASLKRWEHRQNTTEGTSVPRCLPRRRPNPPTVTQEKCQTAGPQNQHHPSPNHSPQSPDSDFTRDRYSCTVTAMVRSLHTLILDMNVTVSRRGGASSQASDVGQWRRLEQ